MESQLRELEFDMASGTQTSAQTFAEIYSVEKTLTKGNITLAAGATILAKYEAGERTINYRRYLVDKQLGCRSGYLQTPPCVGSERQRSSLPRQPRGYQAGTHGLERRRQERCGAWPILHGQSDSTFKCRTKRV
jgi:hypothetical protein